LALLLLGSHLLSLTDGNELDVWDCETGEIYTTIEFGGAFQAVTLCHPSTYVDKILLGSQSGSLQLWNIKTGTLVHELQGNFNQPITVLQQSPALDVMAIGLQDGTIVLYNIQADERVVRFKQDGRVSSISFRTDEHPIMATGNNLGDLALWNLESRKLAVVMKGAHNGSISSLTFLPRQPVLLSSSADNSLKEWIFDSPDGYGRVLRQRSGHSAPPTMIRFYGHQGTQLLSSSSDNSLRHFSILKDSQSSELSQATKKTSHGQSRLPQVIQFAACTKLSPHHTHLFDDSFDPTRSL